MLPTCPAPEKFAPSPHLPALGQHLRRPALPGASIFMAIIRSIAVGKAKKSAGNVTFRTVRGRTIMSEKVGERAETRVPGQYTLYEARFKLISMYIGMHRSSINVSFNKTKYGSQGNYFYKVNKAALEAAISSLTGNAAAATPDMVEAAITAYAKEHPTAIYRVKLSGFDPVYLSDAWDDADNPVSGGASDALGAGTATMSVSDGTYSAPIALGMTYKSGAKIVRPAGTIQLTAAAIPAGITSDNIKFLTSGGNEVGTPVTVSSVVSSAGSLRYSTGAISESLNAVAIQIGEIFIRLTSAYVHKEEGSGQDKDPLG